MDKEGKTISRRAFARGAAAAAAFTIVPRRVLARSGETPPNEKLNMACIGVGGRGGANLNGVKGENIVALCDVDMRRAGKTFEKYPDAKHYHDFRPMLDDMDDKIDAVTVSTPDHTHAVAVVAAIKRGKHVYCEKPLAHSVHEIRAIMKAAHEHNVVTQLGNQGHSSGDIRKCCEWIWDGAIGNVHTIHARCGAVHCKINDLPRLEEKHDVPGELNWDLWLGPAQWRPYHPMFLPGSWRGWSPFGSGTIGDWVCHVVDPSFWALDLGAPKTIEAEARNYDPKKHALTYPEASRVRFEFPGNDKRGAITLYWYGGRWELPKQAGLPPDKVPGTGAVLLGDEGGIRHGSHGAGGVRIFPEKLMRDYEQPERKIPRVRGHHRDWLDAIRSGKQAGSNFDYGGPLTEIAMLGIIGMRMLGRKLEWDSEKMRFTNCDEANELLVPEFRDGWTL